jgi:LPS export ABC transporter protein LptC
MLQSTFYIKLLSKLPLSSLLLFFAISACKNTREQVNAFGKEVYTVDTVKKVESYLSQGGNMKAKLTAPLMLRFTTGASNQPYMEFPNSLYVEFYTDTLLQLESKVSAKYGKYLELEQKIYLKDSVIIINLKNKDTIHCEDLYWDQVQKMFYSNLPISWDSPVQHIKGSGFTAKQDFSEFDIKRIAGPIYVGSDALNNP